MMCITTSIILVLALLINGIRCPGVGGGRGEQHRTTEKENINKVGGGKGEQNRATEKVYINRTSGEYIRRVRVRNNDHSLQIILMLISFYFLYRWL